VRVLRPPRKRKGDTVRKLLVASALSLACWSVAGPTYSQETTPKPVPAITDTTIQFVIQAGNRLYPEWKEEHTVRIGEKFFLGDTPLMGTVKQFLTDFRIIDGKMLNLSAAMNNPAVQVFVLADTGAVDSSWAFLNFPPHFSSSSFYSFQLKEVRGYSGPPSAPGPLKQPVKEQ
jgi:hypothetical protein